METANIFLLGAPSGQEGGGMQSMIMLGLVILVFYFFMIRPQLKKQKEQKKFRESLGKGDKVVTIGGIHGKIVEVKENTVVIQVAPEYKMTLEKSAISSEFNAGEDIKKTTA